MQRNDTQRGRFYEIDGEQFPSVTTILSVIGKPALISWAAKVEREMVMEVSADLYQDAPQVKMARTAWMTTLQTRLGKQKASTKALAKAGEIGTQVHALIEWTLKGELCVKVGPSPEISNQAQDAFGKWVNWRKEVKLKPLFVEQQIWSRQHRYAGTLDLLAEIEGKLTVLDWKTGKAIYPEAKLQNAAYRQAIREMGHGDPQQGVIVRMPKIETDPDFEALTVPEDESYLMKRFLSAYDLWQWQQRNDDVYWDKRKAEEAKPVETVQPDALITTAEAETLTRAAIAVGWTPIKFVTALQKKFGIMDVNKLKVSQLDAALTLANGGA